MKRFEIFENRKFHAAVMSKYFTNELRFQENNTYTSKVIQWRRKVNKHSSYKTNISNTDKLMTWHSKGKQTN